MRASDRDARQGRGGAFLILALGASLAACGPQYLTVPPPPSACDVPMPLASINAHLVSGNIASPFDAPAAQTWTKDSANLSATDPGDCTIYLRGTAAASAVFPGPNDTRDTDAGTLYVNCATRTWSISIDGIVPRQLALGHHVSSPSSADPTFPPILDYHDNLAECTQHTTFLLSVFVNKAIGGAAPLPQTVTADYQRQLTVHLEPLFDTLTPRPACADHAPLLDLTFSESAADVLYRADGRQVCF